MADRPALSLWGDPEQAAEFQEAVKKRTRIDRTGLDDRRVDQFSKPITTVRRRGWHRIGSKPTVEVAPSTRRGTVLGAVTDDGRSFYCWADENLTAAHGMRLLEALKTEFGEYLVILLDRAPYFYAKDLWEAVSGRRTTEVIDDTAVEVVKNETLQTWYFPPRYPELNLAEQCWNQLDAWFKYRLIEDIETLKATLLIALEELDEPDPLNYLLPKATRENV